MDLYVWITNIIAGKAKHAKALFPVQIQPIASGGAGFRLFCAFWEKWGNARIAVRSKKGQLALTWYMTDM
ncbi:hypothetical protein CI266_004657 [Salmonella enterica subsp. enterica serovar Kotte]|nr:hypothetical protein [Salmonella enterica subsp. enterica serovar Kotte]